MKKDNWVAQTSKKTGSNKHNKWGKAWQMYQHHLYQGLLNLNRQEASLQVISTTQAKLHRLADCL